jgi:hypothetical protein
MATTTDPSGALVAADIFQVLIVDGGGLPALPESVERNIRWLREMHPWAKHHLLGNDDIRSLLSAHFSADVLAAYDQQAPFSFRANLARYCLIYLFGGLYVDIGVRFVSALRGPGNTGLVGFRDYWLTAKHAAAVAQGVFLAKAERPELKTAIDMVVANVSARYYGAAPTDVSGPGVFARAIAHHHDGASCWFGQYLPVSPETRLKNFVFITPDGEIVALGKSGAGGDLSYLGLSGVNNYVDIWRSRRVYGEVRKAWPHDALQLKTEVGRRGADGLGYEPPAPGFVLFGPYCVLRPGRYRAVLRFVAGSTIQHCAFDVAYAEGTVRIAHISQGDGRFEDDCVTLAFELKAAQNDVECRMWTDGRDSGRFVELVIEEAREASDSAA